MRNGFAIEVPAGTNYIHVLEFYQSDGTTPRDVSAATVTFAFGGLTLPTTAGDGAHKKVILFDKAQIAAPATLDARVLLDLGGSDGPEDAATGKLRIR